MFDSVHHVFTFSRGAMEKRKEGRGSDGWEWKYAHRPKDRNTSSLSVQSMVWFGRWLYRSSPPRVSIALLRFCFLYPRPRVAYNDRPSLYDWWRASVNSTVTSACTRWTYFSAIGSNTDAFPTWWKTWRTTSTPSAGLPVDESNTESRDQLWYHHAETLNISGESRDWV